MWAGRPVGCEGGGWLACGEREEEDKVAEKNL